MKPGEFERAIKELWPFIVQTSGSSFGSVDGEEFEIHANIELCQSILNNAGYGPKHKYLVHYTSVQTLLEIVSSGKLRMYNLRNFNDPTEMNFIKDICKIESNDDVIETAKDHVFAACFAGADNPGSEDFTMWRLYGNGGHGAAIIFEIKNFQESDFNEFVLGQVSYTLSDSEKSLLKRTFDVLHDCRKSGVNADRLPDFFKALPSLFKDPRWAIERETRLMTVIDNHPLAINPEHYGVPAITNTMRKSLGPRSEITSYIEYPLFGSRYFNGISDQYPSWIKKMPQLRIDSIIAGPYLSDEKCDRLRHIVMSNAMNAFGSPLALKKSIFIKHSI